MYLNNKKGGFYKSKSALPKIYSSGSRVVAIDYDKDGDDDLFIGGRQVPGKYPMPTTSHILKNESSVEKVIFKDVTNEIAPRLLNIGMVTDAISEDIDSDGWQDLVLVGEWMAPIFLKNDKEFYNKCSEQSKKLYRKHYDLNIWKKEMNNIL